jgi:uncharacterized membrane protein YeaQ/YmgE (transglycosylase-associated protein family)
MFLLRGAGERPAPREEAMPIEQVIIWAVVGIVAGFLAGVIVKGYGLGLLGNLVVGVIGAILAGWLLPRLGISFSVFNPLVTSICYATIGAVILLLLIGLARRAG